MITYEGVIAELSRRRFYNFVQEFWREADTSEPLWNWHIEYLCDTLEEDALRLINGLPKLNDIIINCPPGTSKSMITSVLLPAWLLVKKPSMRIITASYSGSIALELSIKTRNLMMGDKFKRVFPEIKIKDDESAKGHYKTTALGGRLTTSTGSNILGMHADIIICDDLQNLDGVYSEAERIRVNRWVTGTLSTRKTDKLNSLMIFVQQRLHQLDLTAHLLSLGHKYKHIVLPGEFDERVLQPIGLKSFYVNSGLLLDEVRLGRQALTLMKQMLGSKNYSAQIQQLPEDDKDSIIKRDWISIVRPEDMPKYTNSELIYFLDTAYGGSNSDYSVVLECFTRNNHLYITNIYRSQEEFPDLIKSIRTFIKSQRVYIEGKASGKSIIQQLKQSTNYNITQLNPTDSKIMRLNAIAPTVEGHRVSFELGVWNEVLLQEVCSNYPQHDDLRDVFTYAVDQLLIKGNNYGKYVIG